MPYRIILATLGVVCLGVTFAEAAPPSQSARSKTACPLTIETGLRSPGGAIEILVPKTDGGAHEDFRFPVTDRICITQSMVTAWKRLNSQYEGNEAFYVTFDPKGTLAKSRSQFDYSVLMCDELPQTPMPPKELRMGRFFWSPKSGLSSVKVIWDSNFRQRIERECA